MEIDIKDLEGVSLLPLPDGRVAYVDKSGTVYMCGLKEESLSDELQTTLGGGFGGELSDAGEQDETQFVMSNIFSDQCANLILAAPEETDLIGNGGIMQDEEEEPQLNVGLIDGLPNSSTGTGFGIFQVEDECVEQVTLFKCRACLFTAPEKISIVNHFTKVHLNVSEPTNTFFSPPGSIPVNEEFERLAQSVAADTQSICEDEQENETEQLLFLCVQCQGAFESIELCKLHMIQEHKFVSGSGKSQPKTDIGRVPELTPSLTNVAAPGNIPIMTLTDDGGIQMTWQAVELPNASAVAENSTQQVFDDNSNKEPEKLPTTTENKLGSSPKEEAQKVKLRTRKIKCSFHSCLSKFSNEKSLQTHISCHSKNKALKEFHCIHCDEKFNRWRLCSAHLWRVHKVDVDLLTCPVCQTYKAATPMKLEIHMRTHGDLRPFRCKLCPKSYKQAAQLRNHSTSVHGDKNVKDVNPRWYMEQQCPHCGKTYSNAKGLKRHIQAVHSKLKPYVCSVCGHSSACKAMLALHLRQHTGEKPHACTQCEYRTGDHNSLRRHMMRHTGQRAYKCPYCSYSAIQSNSYKAHLRNRHPGESGFFSCSSCTFQTVSQDAYVQHVADHQKGLIAPKEDVSNNDEEVEYFPGNVAAAHLVYRYLGTFLQEPGRRLPPANITDSRTSADGTTQSITIKIPSHEDPIVEDDESSHSFFLKGTDDDICIDTGGITIPAEPSDLALIES
ncbi:zinc finger protein 64-like [Thrips palmi]|uniref:Zinc finger protein 64-like n=1 Tax=Thrips palmi TaxID=161013 RepID=A0A6P8ZWV8_THRPL|nr:zinc finger protein 64-like [Thrips palmi]XP_034249605.1 zinc finger protein 64-like [Thrips palmi]